MLTGTCVVVTGGSRGIGYAIAEHLLKKGARVVICSRNSRDIKAATKQLSEHGQIYGTRADVGQVSGCQRLITFAKKKLGKIDILVNNAGIHGFVGHFENSDAKAWEKALRVNIFGTVNCSRLVIPMMKSAGGGKIINFCGGGVGAKSMPRFSAYFTSKIAIAGFSEVLAAELIDCNIQVNVISPGGVDTHLTDSIIGMGKDVAGESEFNQSVTVKRTGGTPPQLTAELITFLAGPESNHLSGRILSAKWNPPSSLIDPNISPDLFMLRRIDNQLFYESPKK